MASSSLIVRFRSEAEVVAIVVNRNEGSTGEDPGLDCNRYLMTKIRFMHKQPFFCGDTSKATSAMQLLQTHSSFPLSKTKSRIQIFFLIPLAEETPIPSACPGGGTACSISPSSGRCQDRRSEGWYAVLRHHESGEGVSCKFQTNDSAIPGDRQELTRYDLIS